MVKVVNMLMSLLFSQSIEIVPEYYSKFFMQWWVMGRWNTLGIACHMTNSDEVGGYAEAGEMAHYHCF